MVAFGEAVARLAGDCDIDVVDLSRAPALVRAEALGNGVGLCESQPGLHAQRQMAAIAQRWDEEWLVRLSLETLAR